MRTDNRLGLSNILPASLKRILRRCQIETIRRQNRGRGVSEIFSDVYQENRWGGEHGRFHSGSGSSDEHALLYSRVINAFITEHEVRHVVDLGCGDFRVGARLIGTGIRYTGIDIVEQLVRNNQRLHGSEQVRFECLNIIDDELPAGDLCLMRQVLQHLSNGQISKVLQNVERYRYVIVTEHYPAASVLCRKNLDKPCGQDVRIYDGSAVFIDAPPFNRRVSGPLLDVDAGRWLMRPGERIRTYLIENSRP